MNFEVNVVPIETEELILVSRELTEKLVAKIPFEEGDVLYDPWLDLSSFFEVFPDHLHKDYRLKDDFQHYNKTVDWVIGQCPSYVHFLTEEDKKYTFFDLCLWFATQNKVKKGFCLLVNNLSYLAITPNRLEILKEYGFVLKKQVMVNLKSHRGRSFFMMFMKEGIEPELPHIDYVLGCY